MSNDSNLLLTGAKKNIRDVFAVTFQLYKLSEKHNIIYSSKTQIDIPKELINLYYAEIKPDYNSMLYSFKRKFVANESLVEKNNTKLEKSGIALVYDYIQYFNPDDDKFNIFVTSLQLHQLLFKPLDDSRNENNEKEYLEVQELLKEAKNNKNLNKYKEAKQKLEKLSNSNSKFGGNLRDDSNDVNLYGIDLEIPNAIEAKRLFNEYASTQKIEEYNKMVNNKDIFVYIDYCIKTIADLIRIQPFNDGNKRTFRALLNLMFKNKNIPPVYITSHEREEYKKALIKAIKDNDYSDLNHFYYYKICDSIYELDISPYLENKNKKIK